MRRVRLYDCLLVVAVVGTDRTGSQLSGRGEEETTADIPGRLIIPIVVFEEVGSEQVRERGALLTFTSSFRLDLSLFVVVFAV